MLFSSVKSISFDLYDHSRILFLNLNPHVDSFTFTLWASDLCWTFFMIKKYFFPCFSLNLLWQSVFLSSCLCVLLYCEAKWCRAGLETKVSASGRFRPISGLKMYFDTSWMHSFKVEIFSGVALTREKDVTQLGKCTGSK